MSSLCELQAGFRAALLDEAEARVVSEIIDDGLGASARLAVYRHHVFTSLTDALGTTYPVVCRLVDRRFFGWLADRYVRAHPPASPCLFEYGGELAAFLAAFPACAHLPWLADVARLEWAINGAQHAPGATPLLADIWRSLDADGLAALTVQVDRSVTLLESPWPVDAIWRANQAGADGAVDLVAGAVRLEVRRIDDDIVLRALPAGSFALRAALAAGRTLQEAVDRALLAEPALNLAREIRALLDDGMLVLPG